jgi:hypothetical protein
MSCKKCTLKFKKVHIIYVNSVVYTNTVQGSRNVFSQIFSDRQKFNKKICGRLA